MNSAAILRVAAAFVTPGGIEIKQPAAFKPIVGPKGRLMELSPADIHIDTGSYQREPIAKHVREIAAAWDWKAYQPISVSVRPDGSMWCYDGQHRLLAAKMRGDIDSLPCWVVDLEGASTEAGSWLAVNNNRRRTKPMEQFKARSVAQDPAHKWFSDFMAKRGLTPTNNKTNMKLGECSAISCCVRQLNTGDMEESKRLITDTFNILLLAWGDQPRCYSGRAVEGMLRLVKRLSAFNRAILATHAKTRLGRYQIAEILDAADAAAKARGGAVLADLPMIFLDRFNYRQRTDLLTF